MAIETEAFMASVTSAPATIAEPIHPLDQPRADVRSSNHPAYPLQTLTGVQVLATGSYVPSEICLRRAVR